MAVRESQVHWYKTDVCVYLAALALTISTIVLTDYQQNNALIINISHIISSHNQILFPAAKNQIQKYVFFILVSSFP